MPSLSPEAATEALLRSLHVEPLACGGANHAVRQQQRRDRHSQAWKSAPLVWGAHCPPGGRAAGAEEVGRQLFPGSPECGLIGAPWWGVFAELPLPSITASFTVRLLSCSAQPCRGSNPSNASEPKSHENPPCGRCLPHAGACLLLYVCVSVGSITLSVWKEGSGNSILYL